MKNTLWKVSLEGTYFNITKPIYDKLTRNVILEAHTQTQAHTHTDTHTETHSDTHTLDYYSAIKKNEIMPSAAT